MSSNSKVTVESLFDKVITHVRSTAFKNNRSIHGYISDFGFDGRTFDTLYRERIPTRKKFALFLTLLVDYLNTHQISIDYEKRNK